MDELTDPASTSVLLSILAEIESAADDVLVDRTQMVELDKKRQENRLAQRHLKSMLTSTKSSDQKTFMCFGNTFLKLPTKTAHSFLESNQKTIDEEINNLRHSLKEKVNKLNEMEEKRPLNREYYLTPLSIQDATNGAAKDKISYDLK